MKGLILKDLYVTWARQKLLLILPLAFVALALVDNNNPTLIIYSSTFVGMLPINLLSMDENEKWLLFCGTLPVTKGQYISGKYILNLISTGVVIAVIAILEAVWMLFRGGFEGDLYTAMMVGVVLIAFLAPSVQLPFVFRFGAEKGRMLFLAVFLAIGFFYVSILDQVQPMFGQINVPLLALVIAAVYATSWLLSIYLFKKRSL